MREVGLELKDHNSISEMTMRMDMRLLGGRTEIMALIVLMQ